MRSNTSISGGGSSPLVSRAWRWGMGEETVCLFTTLSRYLGKEVGRDIQQSADYANGHAQAKQSSEQSINRVEGTNAAIKRLCRGTCASLLAPTCQEWSLLLLRHCRPAEHPCCHAGRPAQPRGRLERVGTKKYITVKVDSPWSNGKKI